VKPGYKALVPLIQSATELPYAECFTITLIDGTVLRYTNLDVPVWLNGQYFTANAVRINGLKFKQTATLEIDEQSIDMICSSSDTIKGVPVLQAIREHVLDGATLQRDRAFFDPATGWPPSPVAGAIAAGGVTLFKGRVAEVTALGRTTATLNVKSGPVLLDVDFPRNIFQASCLHTLYDSGCGLNKGAYQAFGTVGAGATNSVIPISLGGAGAKLGVTMSGTPGASISKGNLTSAAAVNQAYSSVPQVTVSDPTGTGALIPPLVGVNFQGTGLTYGLTGFMVLSGGKGNTNPTITISAGGAGTATAQAVLASGSMSIASMQVLAGGAGYSPSARIVFAGGGGMNAAAVPVIFGGVITGVNLTNAGSGFYTTPSAAVTDDAFANFSQGSLVFQGGRNAGVLAQIKSAGSSQLVLAQPLQYVPQQGDVFSYWPGCDHTMGAGGCAKFNNLENFRGFPFVPPAETAY
jgi:hypothetical protein